MTTSTGMDGGDRALEFSEASTRATLVQACDHVGFDPAGAKLLRLGEHAVFRLRAPVVARIARSADYAADARKEVEVARWLASVGYPAVRAMDVEQPVEVDGRVVVFWESIADDPEYGSTMDAAHLLRRLHGLEAPAALGLPGLDPFGRTRRRLESARFVPVQDREFLRRRMVDLQDRYTQLEFVLPGGVLHGDASVGNVLRDRAGLAVLADLDGVCIGPREWDLAITATYYLSFGWHTPAEYQAFVAGYGFDVTSWPGFTVLREIREVIMVVWLSQKMGDAGRVDDEMRKRLDALRSGQSRQDWSPY